MTETASRASISVKGVVQGVGFRPFVYQLAHKHGLAGWVLNTSGDVRIEVEGKHQTIERFTRELETHAPPAARIASVSVNWGEPSGHTGFEIRRSKAIEGKYQLVSPDIATCDACAAEIFEPDNRRYYYPFTNCTNCGPRFTIIEDIPYDRPRTTMRRFTMCPDCQREYDDPLDRRFHAQPNACPKCGPRLKLVDARGKTVDTANVIGTAVRLLKSRKIIALKGLGGFLLACHAQSETAVLTLRERKKRPSKPLAIMFPSLEQVEEHCEVSPEEAKALTSPESPIVLLRWKQSSNITRAIAPRLRYLGVMLPYTPLHYLLMHEMGAPLVMTSGNLSEEPIASDNNEALQRLSNIADFFILHNRDIYSRYDDSVVMVERDEVQILRRARGYAPYPIRLGFKTKPVLACGAEEKVTFCVTRDDYAFVSQHIGDIENLETGEHFQQTLALYKHLFRLEPKAIACDLHPEYLTTKYARELAEKTGQKLIPVQHHHAHIASCMAENGVSGPVIGVAFDGTGYGSDGKLWGGEFLIADYHGFKRAAHLEYLPLPGGAAAIKRPYRTAVSYLISLMGERALQQRMPFLEAIDPVEIGLIKQQLKKNLNTPLTSSMGRLFDAVSAALGVRDEIDYEGQAAIELEMAAYRDLNKVGDESYLFSLREENGLKIVCLSDLLSAIIVELCQEQPVPRIAARFHNTVAAMTARVCRMVSTETGIKTVALSGGCFQNRLLLRKVIPLLEDAGLTVLTHRQVPTNDGGISLGQAVIAGFAMEKD